jgi:uncharacterized repeat protein (TIGR01451 family)
MNRNWIHAYVQPALMLMLLSLCLGILPAAAQAVEIPPIDSPIFIQTNGPQTPIRHGDWYTSADNGFGGSSHYFSITVPCNWPADLDVHIDLFSPEINTFQLDLRRDELGADGVISETFFELYEPGVSLNLPAEPDPVFSLIRRAYPPVTDRAERWERLYTLGAPAPCGNYILRTATGGDEENGWRLRVGASNIDPNAPPGPNYSNPDGQIGTGDEIVIGALQTTYQHNRQGEVHCLTLYQFVAPELDEIAMHNFDLDNNERIRYYPPSAVYDPNGAPTPGSFAGTLSGNAVWNNGTQTDRGAGDVIVDPESGWWRIVTCVGYDNQFNQEGITSVPAYRGPTPEPDLIVAKTDGRTEALPGELLTYRISFTNQALSTRPNPGAAFNVVLRDTLPPDTRFVACRLVTPELSGRCGAVGNEVTFTLDGAFVAGASGVVEVDARIDIGAQGTLQNVVLMDYEDLIGNPYPTERAEDLTQVPVDAPRISLTKTATIIEDRNNDGKAGPSDVIAYTIVAANSGSAPATDLVIRDEPDQHTRLRTGTATITPLGVVETGNGPDDTLVIARVDSLPPGSAVTLRFEVQVRTDVPASVTEIANQAVASGSNVPQRPSDDPRTPEPDDPTTVPYEPPPTAVELLSFTATRTSDGVQINWVTGVELGTQAFMIYRATRTDFATAAPVTVQPIVARGGPGSGATYTWLDATAHPERGYSYWLIEYETSGSELVYGPVEVGAGMPQNTYYIHLPFIVR